MCVWEQRKEMLIRFVDNAALSTVKRIALQAACYDTHTDNKGLVTHRPKQVYDSVQLT